MLLHKLSRIASHIIFFSIFLLVVINICLLFGISITGWHLPIALFLYGLSILLWRISKSIPITMSEIGLSLATLAILIVVGFGLSHTFDTSYDGQSYHQTAVISLSQGWNPIWDKTLTIDAPTGEYGEDGEYGKHFVIGYPKSIWLIQSAIHKFFGSIQVATITNFVAGMVAMIFVTQLLVELGLSPLLATGIALLSVLSPQYIIEFNTFMQDGLCYQLSLIVIVSLLSFIKDEKISSLMVLLSSLLLLAGSKFSSLPFVAIFALLTLGYLIIGGLLFKKQIKNLLNQFIVVGVILLTSPYIVNVINYGSTTYPSRLDWAQADIRTHNIPLNLKNKNAVELLLYGIFSSPQLSTEANNPANNARLKIPFTFTRGDLTEIQSERVGTGGIFFSGIIIVCTIYLASSLLKKQSSKNTNILLTVVALSLVFVLCALSLPAPNVLRFTPILSLIPVLVLSAMILISMEHRTFFSQLLASVFTVLIVINILSILIPIMSIRRNEFYNIRTELKEMRESGIKYHVYAANFYSSYNRLEENGVKYTKNSFLGCKNPEVLERTFSTSYCP